MSGTKAYIKYKAELNAELVLIKERAIGFCINNLYIINLAFFGNAEEQEKFRLVLSKIHDEYNWDYRFHDAVSEIISAIHYKVSKLDEVDEFNYGRPVGFTKTLVTEYNGVLTVERTICNEKEKPMVFMSCSCAPVLEGEGVGYSALNDDVVLGVRYKPQWVKCIGDIHPRVLANTINSIYMSAIGMYNSEVSFAESICRKVPFSGITTKVKTTDQSKNIIALTLKYEISMDAYSLLKS